VNKNEINGNDGGGGWVVVWWWWWWCGMVVWLCGGVVVVVWYAGVVVVNRPWSGLWCLPSLEFINYCVNIINCQILLTCKHKTYFRHFQRISQCELELIFTLYHIIVVVIIVVSGCIIVIYVQ